MRRSRPNAVARGYFWLAERLYDELAGIYDPVSWVVSLGQWDTVRKLALDYLVGPRVLEVGFGTGELLLEMNRRKFDAYGLDPSAAMHRLTVSKLRRQHSWVPLIRGITQQMPFADNSFDSIVSTFPAGYIFDPATWREADRLLRMPGTYADRGGGRFIVVLSMYRSFRGRSSPPVVRFFFGMPMEDLLVHFKKLAQSANFGLRVVIRRQVTLEVPILIAEKQIIGVTA